MHCLTEGHQVTSGLGVVVDFRTLVSRHKHGACQINTAAQSSLTAATLRTSTAAVVPSCETYGPMPLTMANVT